MPIKQRKTTSVLLILRFTNNITKNIAEDEVQSKPKAGMLCNGKNYRITNSCGVGLHLTKEKKEMQDFFLKSGVILIYAGYLEIKGCILLTMKQTMCSFF